MSDIIFVAFCSDLPQVVNGDFMYNLTEDLLNATKLNGTVVTYICPSGFSLDGNATRTCFNGDWSDTEPVCIAIASKPRVCTYVWYMCIGHAF